MTDKEIKYEEKFIVINKKVLWELPRELHDELVDVLNRANNHWPERKYYVCNQDEPYSKIIIDAILEGEKLKENKS